MHGHMNVKKKLSLLNTATFRTAIWGQNLLYTSESWDSQGSNYEEQWHRALWFKNTKLQRSLLPTASENWELNWSRTLIRKVTVQRNRRAYQLVNIRHFLLWPLASLTALSCPLSLHSNTFHGVTMIEANIHTEWAFHKKRATQKQSCPWA